VSLKQIIAELNVPPAKRTLRDDLNYLKKQGLVELTGRTWDARWVIKTQT
jgi:DeoR/GlpR family transcriptional regulator of sugar metabolism